MPIFFDFVSGKIQGWPIWVDKELSDAEFVGRLEHAGILKAVAISRNLEGFRDAKGSGIWYVVGALPFIPFSFLLVN